MSFFQEPSEEPVPPLELSPEEVMKLDELGWYARAYRRDAPQLTVRAVLTGTVLGFFLSFSNVYIGLKTGWFIGVNLAACILSFTVWRSLGRMSSSRGPMSILEMNCCVSTASAAGYATGHAIVTAVPAVLLLSVSASNPGGTKMAWYVMAPWVFCLAALGVSLAIPMKRSMINRDKLRFPSGTAAAATLQGLYSRGGEAVAKARVLFLALAASAIVPLLKDLTIVKSVDPATGAVSRNALLPAQSNVFDWIPRVLPESWTHRWLHADGENLLPSSYQMKLDHGVALIGAGMLIGLRITGWMVVGGLILVVFVTPPAMEAKWENAAHVIVGAASAGTAWKEIGIWFGAPMLVSGGLVSFATQWRTIGRALSSILPRGKGAAGEDDHADVEVPSSWFLAGVVPAGIGIVVIAYFAFDIPLHLGVLAVLMTFVLALVACRATGESDITPGGPLGKILQLTYGVLMPQSSTANLMTASITSNASLASADLLNDLKAGYLIGANPRRQFLAQALGIGTGTLGTCLAYAILVPDASALLGTPSHAPPFPAPGAQQWKAVAEVFKYGLANLHPMSAAAIKWGLIAGGVLALAEVYAPKAYKKWVPSPTGIGLGFVLPFFYPLAMFLGALFAEIAERANKTWAERYLVSIAAGTIAGESIVGVIVQALDNFVLS